MRPACIDDHGRLVELWTETGISVPPGDSRDELRRKLERDPELFLVLDDGDRLIGSVMGSFDGRRGWIGRLCVSSDHRGRGLAQQLIVAVEERLRAIGCPKVNLLVEPTNSSAVGFYEHVGYASDELIFMEKWLT